MKERIVRTPSLEFFCIEEGTGPLVLLLHGFPDHNRTFDRQLSALAKAGYRAVAPNLPGYAPSGGFADGRYNISRVAGAVSELITALGTEKIHLIGHDWGAVISYVSGALFPEKLLSITAMAVPHMHVVPRGVIRHPVHLLRAWYMFFFQTPLIPEQVLQARDFRLIEWFWSHWSPRHAWPVEHVESVKNTFRKPGVVKAAIGYYRAMRDSISAEGRRTRKLAFSRVPVRTLALCGEDEGGASTQLFDEMSSKFFPAGLTVRHIPSAGHFLHVENPDAVNAEILKFLGQRSA